MLRLMKMAWTGRFTWKSPPEYKDTDGYTGNVYELKRALYGLRISPRSWQMCVRRHSGMQG